MPDTEAPARRLLARWGLPLSVFAAVLIQGSMIGLTDDEAYYWVLAQRPALGYAFHPPAVALCIAAAQALLGWLLGHHCVALVRLPAALCGAGIVALGMRWIERASALGWGNTRINTAVSSVRGGWVLAAFAGVFALGWMMVPDFPMFFAWTLAFVATWDICFGVRASRKLGASYASLCGGIAFAILSKYSGVLAAVSAVGAVIFWAPRERRWPALGAIVVGGLLGTLPILWWNSQHEWASILYQVRERHGGGQLSAVRYLRFWLIEFVLMGPALFVYLVSVAARGVSGARARLSRVELYAVMWAAPALIFCVQPLWADFKPPWALIVWWPLALALAYSASQGQRRKLAHGHIVYGLGLIAAVWVGCQLPVASWIASRLSARSLEPKLDVTNDLYGWPELRRYVVESLGQDALRLPVAGSRYQTASQAAFAMGEGARVTLLPRDLKALDEWPDLDVSDHQGPGWPKLLEPILYVADNRYDGVPEYVDTDCTQIKPLQATRWGYAAKTIFVWKCVPRSVRP